MPNLSLMRLLVGHESLGSALCERSDVGSVDAVDMHLLPRLVGLFEKRGSIVARQLQMLNRPGKAVVVPLQSVENFHGL